MPPTLQDQIDALSARLADAESSVAKAHAAFPALFAFRDNWETWARETGVEEDFIQDILARIPKSVTTNSPPVNSSPVVTTPVQDYPLGAYKRPMRPLTNGEQRNAIDALVRGGQQPLAEPIELNFTKGIYPVCEPDVVIPVRVVRWNDGTPQADKDALDIFLSAIDQRIPNGDGTFSPNLLPIGDPRIVPISGTFNASAPSSVPTPTGNAPVVYADAVVMVNPETGFTNWITTSQNDDGLRIDYNTKYPWQGGAPSNPKLPQVFLFIERGGGVSINGTAPQVDGAGNPIARGEWDNLPGKDFIVYPNGFNRDGQNKAKSVDIACLQAGRTLRFGASRNTADPQFHLEVTPDGVVQS